MSGHAELTSPANYRSPGTSTARPPSSPRFGAFRPDSYSSSNRNILSTTVRTTPRDEVDGLVEIL